MSIPALVMMVYGALVLVGGCIGYLKSKSKISMYSGIVFGIAAVASGLGIMYNKPRAFEASMAISGILLVIFAMRYYVGKKFMPGGLLSILSIIALVVASLGYFQVV